MTELNIFKLCLHVYFQLNLKIDNYFKQHVFNNHHPETQFKTSLLIDLHNLTTNIDVYMNMNYLV